jgi:thiol-disulfide isomerase/thioredoxin
MYQKLNTTSLQPPFINPHSLTVTPKSDLDLAKMNILFLLLSSIICTFSTAYCQSIRGNLYGQTDQIIKLEGFHGLQIYPISNTTIDKNGYFSLPYTPSHYGVGFLQIGREKPFLVILSGEDVEITGEALSLIESINITKGQENKWFEQYAKEHPKREQALHAWNFLEKIYASDPLFSNHHTPAQQIQIEKQRIKNEDAAFLNALPKDSYMKWFLPTRKLVSNVSTIAQYRAEEIPATISAFRSMDYTDERLYKSGLFKEAIENHFWLLENCGKPIDSAFIEMQTSIDSMMVHLIHHEKILNEVTNYLFDLLERHSLFQASEYLALKVLNETSCTLDSDLAKQLESYRAMKKGNVAPEIQFENHYYWNGSKQTAFNNLESLKKPYTVIIFGTSNCPKCTEDLPLLRQLHQKWRKWGVEIVYISLDTDKSTFEKTATSNPFLTYCDYKKWDSPIVKNYFVFGTPTIFLLNAQREILLRPHSIKQMDAWVDWFLIQGNK